MKPLSQLEEKDISEIKLICFDCDGVTVKKGTEIEETESTLTVKTHTLSEKMLGKMLGLKKYFHISFSSGRSLLYLDRMYGKVLWDYASLQGENGIFTLIDGRVIQHEYFSKENLEIMNLMKVDIRELSKTNNKIRGFEPKQFLITVHCWESMPQIEEVVKKYDKKGDYYCWWNGEAYDIGLKNINKGTGLKKLCDYLKFDIKATIAIGNGPNDKDMVDAAGISVTTDKSWLKADFYTTNILELGGEELVDKLLEIKRI